MEIEYQLFMNSEQARETLKAVEFLMRLKLKQYDVIPYNLLEMGSTDYWWKRDMAAPYFKQAFEIYFKEVKPEEYKDDEWYRLYNLYQVLRKAIHDAENPLSTGVDSYEPMQFTDEPLPGCSFTRVKE